MQYRPIDRCLAAELRLRQAQRMRPSQAHERQPTHLLHVGVPVGCIQDGVQLGVPAQAPCRHQVLPLKGRNGGSQHSQWGCNACKLQCVAPRPADALPSPIPDHPLTP